MKTVDKRQVYLEAARKVAEEEEAYSCVAVSRSSLCGYWCPERVFYSDTMKSRNASELTVERVQRAVGSRVNKKRARDFRVLLLCMMAAACDDL